MNPRRRIMAVSVVFAFCLTVVSCKLIWIQLVKQESYRAEAIRCHTRGEPVPAQRGSILDVSGRVLAQSMPLIEVHLDGKILAQEPKELPVIASILGVSAEWLKGQVDPENRYLKVAEGISVETEGKLKASKLRSVITERKTARNYPNGSETAQILGYVNSMEVTPVGMAKPLTVEVGEAGVEKSMDRYLRGVAGERRIIQDVRRREIPYFRLSDRPARDGYHVVLTVDQGIQHVVEREADALVEKYQPETLQIVVLRPSTGEILAMVSRPTFDPNQRATYESWAVKNRILADTYEPGSTFKIVTVAAALNEKVADLNSTFFCENGEMFYGGSSLKDHEDYGMLTLREVVAKSSNIGMAKLAIQLGEEKVHEYARLFGFGQKTQRGEGALPGEEGGLLRPIRRWSKLSITRIPMGYEVAATNLQMALAYGAIANGGRGWNHASSKPWWIVTIGLCCSSFLKWFAKPFSPRRQKKWWKLYGVWFRIRVRPKGRRSLGMKWREKQELHEKWFKEIMQRTSTERLSSDFFQPKNLNFSFPSWWMSQRGKFTTEDWWQVLLLKISRPRSRSSCT